MAVDVSRRTFVQGTAAAATTAAVTMGGPMSAFAAKRQSGSRGRAEGYGPLYPTPEEHRLCSWQSGDWRRLGFDLLPCLRGRALAVLPCVLRLSH